MVSHSLVQTPCVPREERVKGRTGKKENREERRRKERVVAGWKGNVEDGEFLLLLLFWVCYCLSLSFKPRQKNERRVPAFAMGEKQRNRV
jgi:hypothetical protein